MKPKTKTYESSWPTQKRTTASPIRPLTRQPPVAGGVDDQRPDERADDDEREVLEAVQERVASAAS